MDHSLAKKKISQGNGSFKRTDFKEIGEHVIIEKGVEVYNPQNIKLGNNIYIGHKTVLKSYHFKEMEIGDNTRIGRECLFHSAGGIKIGKSVGIGHRVSILTSQHRSEFIEIPLLFSPLEFKPVEIEEGSEIGIGAIILPGVKIGKGSIVHAGAVVGVNVPEFEIWGGVPAVKISSR